MARHLSARGHLRLRSGAHGTPSIATSGRSFAASHGTAIAAPGRMLPLPLDSKSPARHAALVVLSAGATLLGGFLAEATTPPERSRVEPVVVVIDQTCPPPSAEVATAPETQRFIVRTAAHRLPAIVSISGGHEHVLRLEYLPAGDPLRELGFASGMAVHTVGLSSANEIIETVYAPLLGLARDLEEDAPCSLSCSSHLRRVGRQPR